VDPTGMAVTVAEHTFVSHPEPIVHVAGLTARPAVDPATRTGGRGVGAVGLPSGNGGGGDDVEIDREGRSLA
jgi:hypothetical protein